MKLPGASLGLALLAAAAMLAGGPASATTQPHPTAQPYPTAQPQLRATRPQPPPHPGTVTLVTGEKVRLVTGTDGRPAIRLISSPHGQPPLINTVMVGGDMYAIPSYAGPYLGKLLDPALFDVSYLQRTPSHRLRLTWRDGRHASMPSQNISAGLHALLTGPPQQAGPLTGLTHIGLGSAPAATPLTTSVPHATKVYSLTVQTIDRTTQPYPTGIARIDIQNTDDLRHFWSVTFVKVGTPLSVSVPAGHYSVEVSINLIPVSSFGPGVADLSFMAFPDVTVTADTTVTADASTARPLTVTTPTPSVTDYAAISYSRTSLTGGSFAGAVIGAGPGFSPSLPPLRLFVTPTTTSYQGKFGFAHTWSLVPAGYQPGTNPASVYYLDFPSSSGIPARLGYRMTSAELATVHESYAADIATTAQETVTADHPWSPYQVSIGLDQFAIPGTRTDYFGSATPSARWTVQAGNTNSSGHDGFMAAAQRTYQAGQTTSETWLQSPRVPAPEVQSAPGVTALNGAALDYANLCPACRQDDNLMFNVLPYGDSDPAHWLSGDKREWSGPVTQDITFYRNNVLIGQQPSTGGLFPMLPGDATYKIGWTRTTAPGAWTNLDTKVTTVWTFRSQRTARPDKLPPYELCGPDATRGCSFVPLIFARYGLKVNLAGQAPSGKPESFLLTGYYQPHETGAPVTSAQVQVSYDDGATWAADPQVLPVRAGTFRVTVPAMPSGTKPTGYVSLRVRLASGTGSLTQTIIRAYSTPPVAGPARHACGIAAPGHVRCMALIAAVRGTAGAGADPQYGYSPAQLRAAYRLGSASSLDGGGQTIAIVDAYDDPNAAADLRAYRAQFKLPLCDAANGCFRKVNQSGTTTPLPAASAGWAAEISLDLDMVSAICPRCRILLVEASSNNSGDMYTAEDEAVTLGARYISDSWGTPEYATEGQDNKYFDHPGVTITAASGDDGYDNYLAGATAPSWPAASPDVVAVGATTLVPAGGARGWKESVWADSGSGCSALMPKPAWQGDSCTHKMSADVAVVGDPATGVAIYDSYGTGGTWQLAGGTSTGSPIIASLFALAGKASGPSAAAYTYAHRRSLFDVTSGSNGTCYPAFMCTAGRGYDGPTGLGTPDGIGAF